MDSYQAQLVVLSMQIAWSEGIDAALAAINGSEKMDPLAKALTTTEDTLTLLADSVLQVTTSEQILEINKFVWTKMRPKNGAKIELQRDLSDLQVGLVSDLSDLSISAIYKKTRDRPRTDRRTDRRTDGQTDRPSYRDA